MEPSRRGAADARRVVRRLLPRSPGNRGGGQAERMSRASRRGWSRPPRITEPSSSSPRTPPGTPRSISRPFPATTWSCATAPAASACASSSESPACPSRNANQAKVGAASPLRGHPSRTWQLRRQTSGSHHLGMAAEVAASGNLVESDRTVVHDPANLCQTSAELCIFRSRALCKVRSCKPLVFGMTHAIRNGIGMISMRQGSHMQGRPRKTLLVVEED